MEREERVYELSYIESYGYVAKARDIGTTLSRGDLMMKIFRASNENGEFVLGRDQGQIKKVHFLNPELNTEEMNEVMRPWEFNHKKEDKKIFTYQEFVSMGKPKRIKITTTVETLETLDKVLAG